MFLILSPFHKIILFYNKKMWLSPPHIASASAPGQGKKWAHMAVDNIIAAIKNERIPYCYNPSVYD